MIRKCVGVSERQKWLVKVRSRVTRIGILLARRWHEMFFDISFWYRHVLRISTFDLPVTPDFGKKQLEKNRLEKTDFVTHVSGVAQRLWKTWMRFAFQSNEGFRQFSLHYNNIKSHIWSWIRLLSTQIKTSSTNRSFIVQSIETRWNNLLPPPNILNQTLVVFHHLNQADSACLICTTSSLHRLRSSALSRVFLAWIRLVRAEAVLVKKLWRLDSFFFHQLLLIPNHFPNKNPQLRRPCSHLLYHLPIRPFKILLRLHPLFLLCPLSTNPNGRFHHHSRIRNCFRCWLKRWINWSLHHPPLHLLRAPKHCESLNSMRCLLLGHLFNCALSSFDSPPIRPWYVGQNIVENWIGKSKEKGYPGSGSWATASVLPSS